MLRLPRLCNKSPVVIIFTTFIYLFLVSMYRNDNIHTYSPTSSLSSNSSLNFMLILCGGEGSHKGSKHASDLNRQFRQAEVMLKSMALLTRTTLHLHVLVDTEKMFRRLVELTDGWPENYKRKLVFYMHDIWYPEDREDMRTMFRVCATERLFIPDMFPHMDRAIYIDTDLIFMRPPEDLWDFFDDFSSSQIAAMAPCMYHYGTDRNKVPFYGETGLNAGIMHMDFQRMNSIPDGWTGACLAIADKYRTRIKLADQDILNILFSFYPEKLYELPCEWNYRVWLCSQQGGNKCPTAEENGVAVLHGNALAFVKGHEMKIQKIYETFQAFKLGRDSIRQLYTNAAAALIRVDSEDLRSFCKRVPGIDRILLSQLYKQVEAEEALREEEE